MDGIGVWTLTSVGIGLSALNDRSDLAIPDVVIPTNAERDAPDRFVGPDVQRVLDALPSAVLLIESSSLVSGSNALAAQLFGVSSADLAGRCVFDLMAAAGTGPEPGQAADLRSALSSVMGGQSLVETVALHQPDGVVSVAHFAPWFDDR